MTQDEERKMMVGAVRLLIDAVRELARPRLDDKIWSAAAANARESCDRAEIVLHHVERIGMRRG